MLLTPIRVHGLLITVIVKREGVMSTVVLNLEEIQKRVETNAATQDDILYLLEKAKQSHDYQSRYQQALEDLEEMGELRIRLDQLTAGIAELESVYSNVN
jgi:hypothetical protein